MVSSAAANSLITKEDSVPRADGKGDEATSVVSATESDSGEATSLSSTFVVLSSCCKVPFPLPNDRSTKLLTSPFHFSARVAWDCFVTLKQRKLDQRMLLILKRPIFGINCRMNSVTAKERNYKPVISAFIQ